MSTLTEDLNALLDEKQKLTDRGLELSDAFDPENTEQVEELRGAAQRITAIDTQVATLREGLDLAAQFRTAQDKTDEMRASSGLPVYSPDGSPPQDDPVTPGELFVRSEAYAQWMAMFPGGGPSTDGTSAQSNGVPINASRMLGLESATDRMRAATMTPDRFRALVTSVDASAGHLVRPAYQGLLGTGLVRPLTIRDLVTVIPIATDAIEFVRELSRTANAAPVAEATAVTGTSGLKPEGGLTFELVTDTIKTIAEWVPATRRILSDATGLRAYIDQFLVDDLSTELEDQIVNGTGGAGLLGVLQTPGIQTAGPHTGTGNTQLDTLRTAKRLIQVNAQTNPTGVAMNPQDLEAVERLKDSTYQFLGAGPFATQYTTVWGMSLVESQGVPAGTAVVADWRRAVLWDRESINISVGTVNDDFIRNIVRVLAEMRAGFTVIRPSAFVNADMVP